MNEISLTENKSLKGKAIIMVVISHVVPIYGMNFVNIFGAIGVALFLFLSGYGLEISFEKSKCNQYFIKKIRKVYVPYLLTVGLFLIWSLCIGEKFNLIKTLKYCILLELPQGSYWFLIILFYFYFVFADCQVLEPLRSDSPVG